MRCPSIVVTANGGAILARANSGWLIYRSARCRSGLSRLHLHKLLELRLCGVVLLQVRERPAIDKYGIWKFRIGRQRLGHLIVCTGEELILVPVQPLVHQDDAKFIVRQRYTPLALSLSHNLTSRGFCGFPVAQFNSVLDHLLLTCCAVPAVLLVRFLEALECRSRRALVQIL